MAIDLLALAQAAANTIAGLASTEAWQAARERLRRIIRDDHTAEEVVQAAESADANPNLAELLHERLSQDHALAQRLQHLLQELASRPGNVSQTAAADRGAVVIQAGRDVHQS